MKENIELEEYIRTDWGTIFKLQKKEWHEKEELYWYEDATLNNGCWSDQVIKHSFSVIDLIEVRRLCKWKINS